MNERLHWEKKSVNWALAVGLAVLFFIVLAIVMERLWAGVAVAVLVPDHFRKSLSGAGESQDDECEE